MGYIIGNNGTTQEKKRKYIIGELKPWKPEVTSPGPRREEKQSLSSKPLLKVPEFVKSTPIKETLPEENPVIGEDYFLLNAFPIRKNDNPVIKGLKAVGNFGASTADALPEVVRKLSLQGGSILTGGGIRKDLPRNTTFVGDILKPALPQGASQAMNNLQQEHPILGNVANMALETAADPTALIGSKAITNLMVPKAEQGLLKASNIALPTKPLPNESKPLPKPLSASNELPKVELPKVETKLEPPLPKAAGSKERQFTSNSVLNSQVATKGIKQELKEKPLTYEPITNRETFDRAKGIVNEDPKKALEYFNSPSKGVSADDVALGEALITKAIKDGNTEEANRLIADLAEKLTTAGQAVQAASIFKRLTPEGMLLYAQRVINTANKELMLRKSTAKKIALSKEDSEFILSKMKEVQKLPDSRDKDIALAEVMQLIANKVPATMSDKAKGIQRISLLLNPKTMTRNFLGNTLFGTIDNLSNVVGTPIDKATSLLTKKRTTTLPSLTGQLKSGIKGARETLEDARLGIDTYSGKTQFELPSKRIFDTETLNKLDQATRVGLQLGDRPFYQAAFDDTLRQQMKLSGVAEPTQEMIDQAHKIAQQRTYQDVNSLTNAFKLAQKALNFGKPIGLGNVVLPFVKTPANILKRAIEYSPIGIEKAIREATRLGSGTFDQKTFVDSISRSVTGTALIMVGYDLAKKGVITGSGNKDKDVAAFERDLGKNDFAYKHGDKYYTYDWAQPASMALAVGADIFLKGKDRKEAEGVVAEAIKSGGETLFKQSLLQGVQRFMGGYSPMENLASTAINAPSMLVPTLSKQFAQTIDPIKRSTSSSSNLGTGANIIKSKIPGLSKTLEPQIDTFGNTIENFQGKNNPFNVFVNPGFSSEFKPNKVQSEILRLYETTGDKSIFPRVAPKSFTSGGEKIALTPKEITAFQQAIGKRTEEFMKSIIARPMTDEEKIKELRSAIDRAYEEAKQQLLSKR